jgi:hypothetical protein
MGSRIGVSLFLQGLLYCLNLVTSYCGLCTLLLKRDDEMFIFKAPHQINKKLLVCTAMLASLGTLYVGFALYFTEDEILDTILIYTLVSLLIGFISLITHKAIIFIAHRQLLVRRLGACEPFHGLN